MKRYLIVKEAIDEWDPIQLLHDAPDDEYEPEIRDIENQLPAVTSPDDLALVIHHVFNRWFGDDFPLADRYSIKNCYPCALKIWEKIRKQV